MADDEQAKTIDEQNTAPVSSTSNTEDTTDKPPSPSSDSSSKTKEPTAAEQSEPSSESTQTPDEQPTAWQAIFSPQHNAYYFFNSETQETTWINPLDPSASASTSGSAEAAEAEPQAGPSSEPDQTSSATPAYSAMQAAALAAGVDPALAHLDPSLAYGAVGTGGGPIPTFSAKFNARTGAFAPTNSRDPTHLSEYERMKRMSEFYFDVNQWEKDVAKRKEEEEEAERDGKKRKRPTKKDLERFKEQKKQKKIAKTAWLRQ
ncbi:hypothetical protein HGRIS_012208 [Hohenbuehelia grisea]|uniref:WW domain-containing protein n=1 Tax=Hohenbuehelia grisea TaxID=104357 RepID=A0ABR3IRM8_9AGAR